MVITHMADSCCSLRDGSLAMQDESDIKVSVNIYTFLSYFEWHGCVYSSGNRLSGLLGERLV